MRPLKILMCCQFPILPDLGGPKGYIEIAETYRMKGHEVTLVGIDEIVGAPSIQYHEDWRLKNFSGHLKNYILKHGNNYDVIEFESIYLPYDLKNEVKSILVARSVLLELHFLKIHIPVLPRLKSWASHYIKYYQRQSKLKERIRTFITAMKYADVINVSNPSDKTALIDYGLDEKKIVMQPYGIYQRRFDEFQKLRILKKKQTSEIIVAFVGSFDRRKGAVEFPYIIRQTIRKHQHVKFRLMGVIGLFRTSQEIINFFPEEVRQNIEIIPRYTPEELPHLLKECLLGIFPSYLESFGFGVLEMMSMGLPVVGYDAPGTSMLLPSELLAPIGNKEQLMRILIQLIEDSEKRDQLGRTCLERARGFIYESQYNASLDKYKELLASAP